MSKEIVCPRCLGYGPHIEKLGGLICGHCRHVLKFNFPRLVQGTEHKATDFEIGV